VGFKAEGFKFRVKRQGLIRVYRMKGLEFRV
jgi:phage terminase large subunit GpA-like protein